MQIESNIECLFTVVQVFYSRNAVCILTILSVDTRSCGSSRGGTIHLSGTFNSTLPMYSRRSVHRMRGTTAISQSMDTAGSTSPSLGGRFCHMVCACVGRLICWIDGACVCACRRRLLVELSLPFPRATLSSRWTCERGQRTWPSRGDSVCVSTLHLSFSSVSPYLSPCHAVQRNATRKMIPISLPLSMNRRLER